MAAWTFGSSAGSPWFARAAQDTTRSAAGRAAVEAAIWAHASLLLPRGVVWHAESSEHIVAAWEVPPERPEVHIKIGRAGAVRSVCVMRWDDGNHGLHGYIPCGGEVQAERRFGDLVVASDITVGWWFDTPAGHRSSKPGSSTAG